MTYSESAARSLSEALVCNEDFGVNVALDTRAAEPVYAATVICFHSDGVRAAWMVLLAVKGLILARNSGTT